MNTESFFYRLYRVNTNGTPAAYLGTAFPVAQDGGLLTCRHVVDIHLGDGEGVSVFDAELKTFVPIGEMRFPADPTRDIAYLPYALGRQKAELLPLLDPRQILTGSDVYSFGFFLESSDALAPKPGYFKGNIVNLTTSPVSDHVSLTLSYAVVEGLSGSPVLTYHNGTKVVGLAFGSTSSRVSASEVIEYQDGDVKLKETINRIVEFGKAYHVTTLLKTSEELGIEFLVSSERVDLPDLG